MSIYKNPENAGGYINFLSSENGKIQKRVLFEAIFQHIPKEQNIKILDAACGEGWLAFELNKQGFNVCGCDASENLIDQARELYPEIEFKAADLGNLPYPAEHFDYIILNMAVQDLEDQKKAFENLKNIIKPGGKLIATLPNPYYAYPVGVWKRGILNSILRRKPKLQIASAYNLFTKKTQYSWGKELRSHFYPLSDILNNFTNAGFSLSHFEELKTKADSQNFDLNYQLYRFPILLLLEFNHE
jgi:ubiquinone/menaquinone biosynthesis C-methylase UbiE